MLFIKEALPNPAGKDANGEWIKIINDGEQNVSPAGWKIKDASGKTFDLSHATQGEPIAPDGEIIITYATSRISLNNDGDTIILVDPSGKEADVLEYGQAGDDEVILAERFIERAFAQAQTGERSAASMSGTQFTGELNAGTINTQPILVGVAVAVCAGIICAKAAKEIIKHGHE